MNTNTFGVISGLIGMVGAAPYLYDTFRKKTKPHRFAWLIFLILSLISFCSQFALGARASLYFVGWTVINNILVFGLSLRKGGGYGKINAVNIIAFTLAIASIILWRVTDSPFIALICVLIADGIGALLILVKSYKQPHTETVAMWILGIFAGIFSILAVGDQDLKLLASPIQLTVFNIAIVVAIYIGRKRLRSK